MIRPKCRHSVPILPKLRPSVPIRRRHPRLNRILPAPRPRTSAPPVPQSRALQRRIVPTRPPSPGPPQWQHIPRNMLPTRQRRKPTRLIPKRICPIRPPLPRRLSVVDRAIWHRPVRAGLWVLGWPRLRRGRRDHPLAMRLCRQTQRRIRLNRPSTPPRHFNMAYRAAVPRSIRHSPAPEKRRPAWPHRAPRNRHPSLRLCVPTRMARKCIRPGPLRASTRGSSGPAAVLRRPAARLPSRPRTFRRCHRWRPVPQSRWLVRLARPFRVVIWTAHNGICPRTRTSGGGSSGRAAALQ